MACCRGWRQTISRRGVGGRYTSRDPIDHLGSKLLLVFGHVGNGQTSLNRAIKNFVARFLGDDCKREGYKLQTDIPF
jgi:hypothetical protein